MPRRVPDVSKLKGLVGLPSPAMGIREITKESIAYYREV